MSVKKPPVVEKKTYRSLSFVMVRDGGLFVLHCRGGYSGSASNVYWVK